MSRWTAAPRTLAISASPLVRAWIKPVVGCAILVAVILHAGAEPFLRGITSLSVLPIVAATVLAAIATSAAAWRWRLIAGGLDIPLAQTGAVAAYYRSQFLNTVLPGGVLGDVHRAIAHGRSVRQVGDASRAVVAERTAGQTVQLVVAAVVLASLGVWAYAPAVGVMVLAVLVVCAGVVLAATLSRRARTTLLRELQRIRAAFAGPRTIVGVVAASAVVVACHVATFVVATVAVGARTSPQVLAAVALIAVLAGSIPLNVGGWGPREGAAAWAFAAAGLGSATGIAAATAYGVLAMIAVAPGAAVIAASVLRRRRGDPLDRRHADAMAVEEPTA
ncbi:lysylphosphatidylglycerol synthase transmembrane domain-containing protein [Microbacterium sp. BK668]|uniref:lysylphosphatidylglycerol synthase transmembrane domain-containing protein n=1 Tax=Microbacterium sp. BK668 TaxID=2512118 RepID=UPI00106206DF|nr:lysylphosphatidylglycerol synthase transmembrane domain-containing protein [Microbacterium sp. BK668]TDN91693.1 uncharacterized protein (TIRG00374 family) [Microbacterium sp. BK668]